MLAAIILFLGICIGILIGAAAMFIYIAITGKLPGKMENK